MAITKFDQFDFLIDIVPRDELKPTKRPVLKLLICYQSHWTDLFKCVILYILLAISAT